MSEFRFVCPVCGQQVKVESWRSNSMMECPSCFQRIIVPQAPATGDVELVIKGSKATRRIATKPEAAPKPPAPPPKKSSLPAVAFVVLLCAVVAGMFVFRDKLFKSAPVQTSGPTNGGAAPSAVPASANTNWTLDLDSVTIPDTPLTGYIHGKLLIPGRMALDKGTLTLRTADFPPEAGVSIYLPANRSQDFAGLSINIKPDTHQAPWVNLRWKDSQGQPLTQTVTKGYALRIEFGQVTGDVLPGKIYLCTPDETKSWLKGAFDAEIVQHR